MVLVDYLIAIYLAGVFTLAVRIGIGLIKKRIEINLRLILEMVAWPLYLTSKDGRKALFKIIIS